MDKIFFRLVFFIILTYIAINCSSNTNTEDVPHEKTIQTTESTTNGSLDVVMETFETGKNNFVRALATEGNTIWIGTSTGVMHVNMDTGTLLNTYTRKDGLKNEYVFTIAVDKKGTKWFGTNAGGLTLFDGKKWKTYIPLHGLADYWIYALNFESDGTAWIGTWEGVNKFDGETFTTYSVDDGLINEWVYGIGIDKNNVKWFATEGGVTRFDGKTWKSWTNKDGLGIPNKGSLPHSKNSALGTRNRHDLSILDNYGKKTYMVNYVFSAFVDRDDNKWFGTWGGGVSKFDGTTFTSYSTDNGLAGNVVYAISQDKDGALWFGTSGGVSKFHNGVWQSLTKKDGLLDSNVYAIAIGNNNDIWLGQGGGVVKIIEKRNLQVTEQPVKLY